MQDWKEQMLKKLHEEKPLTEWSVNLSREAKKGRFAALQKKGLLSRKSNTHFS